MKNIVGNQISKFLVVLLLLAFAGCDDTLDLKPYAQISDASAFSTPSLIELSMVGVYNACQSGVYYNGSWSDRGYPFGAASTEQGEARGEDVVNTQSFFQITYEGTYDQNATYNNISMWVSLFAAINKTNIMIEGAANSGASGAIPTALAADYQAQARFIRALCYHELLIHFAKPYNDGQGNNPGLPIRSVAVTSASIVTEQLAVGRSTVAETYQFVLDDLAYAEANIDKTRKSITRATLGAVYALQSRVYLHMSNWDKVIETGKKIAPLGYALTAAPDGAFSNFASNTESIFSMENSSSDNAGVNAALPGMLSGNGTRRILAVSPILWNQGWWPLDDLRRTKFVVKVNLGTTAAPNWNYFTNKYRDFSTNTDYTPLIRYAEVVLNMAEAYARKNDFTNALTNLNLVRNRSVTTVASQFTASSFTTQKDWVQAVLRERRIELQMEGRRWADIHRLVKDADFTTNGIPGKVANGWPAALYKDDGSGYSGPTYASFPYTDKRFLWPIPAFETNSNPTLAAQQNPGW